MNDIYVVTRYWDNDEYYDECFELDEHPFMAFKTYEDALKYLKHKLSSDDILGDLVKTYYIDDITPFDSVEGEHYGGVWYKCKGLNNRMYKCNIRFIIYKIKMGERNEIHNSSRGQLPDR